MFGRYQLSRDMHRCIRIRRRFNGGQRAVSFHMVVGSGRRAESVLASTSECEVIRCRHCGKAGQKNAPMIRARLTVVLDRNRLSNLEDSPFACLVRLRRGLRVVAKLAP